MANVLIRASRRTAGSPRSRDDFLLLGVGDVPTKAAGPATLSTVCVVVVGVVARAGRSALLEVVHAAARALQGADGKCVAPRPSLYRIQSISRVARTQSTLLQQGTPSSTDTNVHWHIMQVINTHSTSPTRNTAAPREVAAAAATDLHRFF